MSSMQAWEAIARQTLERSSVGELNWILYASQDLYLYWRQVCMRWIDGELLGPDENEGKQKKMDMVTPALFKCFESDLIEKYIFSILDKIMEGRCLLKKDKNNKSDIPSMSDLAKNAKCFRAMKPKIGNYLCEKYPEHFPADITWKGVTMRLPELADEKEMTRCKVMCGEQYVLSITAKNKKELTMPDSLQNALNVFVAANFGVHLRERKVSFLVVKTEDLCVTTEPTSLGTDNPTCPLAIVDFGRRDVKAWSVEQLKVFFRWIVTYIRCQVINVGIFVRPGLLFFNILQALDSIKDFYIQVEFGSYAGPKNRFLDPKLVIADQRELVLLAGFANQSKHDWADEFSELTSLHFQYLEKFDMDFRTNFHTNCEQIPKGENREEKEARLREEYVTALKAQAPRYDKGGADGGWVNPDCKPYAILKELITSLTTTKQTVFDFFSGGQVLKAALFLQRECIVFVDTPKECLFVEAYPHLLRALPRVDKFWSLMESIHRGEKVVDEDDVSYEDSQMPAGQDGQEVTNVAEKDVAEEAVIVHKLNANQSTTQNALAALGIFNLQNEATTSGGAVENNVQGIHTSDLGAEREEAKVVPANNPLLDTTQGIDILAAQQAQAEASGANEGLALAISELPTGSSPLGQTHQASVHLSWSPNLSSYSSLSNSIQMFVNSKKNVSSVGALSITTNKPIFSHYEWACGMKKGTRLDPEYAECLLCRPGFEKDQLKKIWVPGKVPVHIDSIELQQMLGKTKVSEYGSFVDRS